MSEATLRAAVARAVINTIANKEDRLATTSQTGHIGWKRRLVVTGASVAVLTALSIGSAAAQTWTGTTSNDWMDATNWSTGAVPTGVTNPNISAISSNPTVLGVNGPATGASANLFVGQAPGSFGNLTIQNGSTLTSTGNSIQVAAGAGSTGTVTVTGAGSRWTTSGTQPLFVGLAGTGTLNIQNGGEVVAQTAVQLGRLGGASGTLNINSGGILETTGVTKATGAGQINFDNGIVRAMANTSSFFNLPGAQLNIEEGGLTFDTNGFNVGTLGFSGVGGLTVTGAGIFSLGANNIYAGQTVIDSGSTLALQSKGSIAASSRLVDNGTFDISATLASSSSIQSLAGSGTVAMGAKSLTLTNANDTFAGAFTGTGGLTLAGGMETLTGDSSAFTGPNSVQAGTLAVNGSLGGTMDVLSGGTLQGNGTVGATTARSGGIIAPGNSIGTLHVNGNFIQQSGSTYQVQLDPTSSASDLIAVNGTASLQSGSILSASAVKSGDYTPNTIYKVLNASGGVTGTYALTGGSVSAFLTLVDSYDANDVYLKVVQTRDPGDAAQTGNQGSTAGGASGTGAGNVLLNSQSDAAARYALDQLSGASSASAKGAMIYDSRYTRELAIDRLRDMFCTTGHASQSDAVAKPGAGADKYGCAVNPNGIAVWGQAFGSWGHSNGNLNASRIDRSSSGFVTGIDGAVGNDWRVGVLTGYSLSNYGVGAQNASTGSEDYHVGAYAGSQWGALAVRLGSTFTWHDVSATRMVVLPDLFNSLHADYNAQTSQVFAEFGYQIRTGAFDLEPFLNLAYVNLHTDGFAEQGGITALTSRSGNTDTGFTTLGMRASTDFMVGPMAATVRGTLGWMHAYGDITPVSVMSFAGGNPFTVSGVPIATDAAMTEAGFDLHVAPQATLGISYNGQFGDGAVDQSVRGIFTMQF